MLSDCFIFKTNVQTFYGHDLSISAWHLINFIFLTRCVSWYEWHNRIIHQGAVMYWIIKTIWLNNNYLPSDEASASWNQTLNTNRIIAPVFRHSFLNHQYLLGFLAVHHIFRRKKLYMSFTFSIDVFQHLDFQKKLFTFISKGFWVCSTVFRLY